MTLARWLLHRRSLPLPAFELAPLEFDPEAGTDDSADTLILDEVVASIAADSTVVRLVAAVPTAGELRDSIERHLRSHPQDPIPDAADELRSALAELKQSLA